MPAVLVTGASGFLGWHIVKLLLERGFQVRALCRSSSKLQHLDVERVTGDLRDAESLKRAARGCYWVFHAAADYRLWTKNPRDIYDSNVEGTRHLLAAAKGAERIVYTSTVGCIGLPAGHDGDEATPVSIEDIHGHYKRSKWLAEQVALDAAREGQPVVIVNPTAPIGDHDSKPTPTGKIIVDFLSKKLPAFVDTGLNLVDVRDVAMGHLQAAEKGRAGERYILGCENLTLERILQRLSPIASVPAPSLKLPYAVAYAAGIISTGWAHLSGQPPAVALEAVQMARKKMFVSHAKAVSELGYAPGSVDCALQRAVEWFRANGYC